MMMTWNVLFFDNMQQSFEWRSARNYRDVYSSSDVTDSIDLYQYYGPHHLISIQKSDMLKIELFRFDKKFIDELYSCPFVRAKSERSLSC